MFKKSNSNMFNCVKTTSDENSLPIGYWGHCDKFNYYINIDRKKNE